MWSGREKELKLRPAKSTIREESLPSEAETVIGKTKPTEVGMGYLTKEVAPAFTNPSHSVTSEKEQD